MTQSDTLEAAGVFVWLFALQTPSENKWQLLACVSMSSVKDWLEAC